MLSVLNAKTIREEVTKNLTNPSTRTKVTADKVILEVTVNVEEIGKKQLRFLSRIADDLEVDVNIKRSGKGMCIKFE